MPGNDYVQLVLRVGLLWVVTLRRINFYRHRTVPEEFDEGFIFVGPQLSQRFQGIDFHGQNGF